MPPSVYISKKLEFGTEQSLNPLDVGVLTKVTAKVKPPHTRNNIHLSKLKPEGGQLFNNQDKFEVKIIFNF